jgi:pyruvate formate lyase activating enzyme
LVEIKGLEPFASKDFPGHISATVFLGGCNFRCPYCHNSQLVLDPQSIPTFPVDYLLGFLDIREDWLEGICVTGGEPLLHPDLDMFLSVLKDRDLLVKLDTNGSFPNRLEVLLEAKLVDYVAMDIKAPLDRYSEVVKVEVDRSSIERSIELIRNSGVPAMFRTTVVPGLVDREDLKKIGNWLKGEDLFQIQPFSPNNTLDPSFEKRETFSREEVKFMAEDLEPLFKEIRLEGI